VVHGIAKGVRRGGKQTTLLERGLFVETTLYFSQQRTLHTLGEIHPTRIHPQVRSDLHRSALRDVALESVLKTIHIQEPHPEAFELMSLFMETLENHYTALLFPATLWHFHYDFCRTLGFGFDTQQCIKCDRALAHDEGATLSIRQGGVVCDPCMHTRYPQQYLSGVVRDFLNSPHMLPPAEIAGMDYPSKRQVTRLLADYCRYHFEHPAQYKALEFVCGLLV
jgi:DNA repair protein RecO